MRPAKERPSRTYRPNGLLDKAKTGLLRPNSTMKIIIIIVVIVIITITTTTLT
jgi:hypothetical protein